MKSDYMISVNKRFIEMHSPHPSTAGMTKETTVHLRLPVFFFIVSSVVAHGK